GRFSERWESGPAARNVRHASAMNRELQPRLLARMCIWQFVAACVVGWNVPMLDEDWTNWNWLSFGCQIVLFACAWREIRGWEEPVTRWISFLMRRFER